MTSLTLNIDYLSKLLLVQQYHQRDYSYNTLVAALNLLGSSGSFQNFYTALNVIPESYFKSSVGSEDEKPTKRDAPELLTQFLSLLENCTCITTVRKLYDQLSCLMNFSQSSQSNKRDILCASERLCRYFTTVFIKMTCNIFST